MYLGNMSVKQLTGKGRKLGQVWEEFNRHAENLLFEMAWYCIDEDPACTTPSQTYATIGALGEALKGKIRKRPGQEHQSVKHSLKGWLAGRKSHDELFRFIVYNGQEGVLLALENSSSTWKIAEQAFFYDKELGSFLPYKDNDLSAALYEFEGASA
jgi:hypothetical protein